MNNLLGMKPEFEVNAIFGRCELRSWFELCGDKLIGMGSKKTYDQNGELTDYSESQTVLVMTMPNAKVSRHPLANRTKDRT